MLNEERKTPLGSGLNQVMVFVRRAKQLWQHPTSACHSLDWWRTHGHF